MALWFAYEHLNTSQSLCFDEVISVLSSRLSRRMQLVVLRYCKNQQVSVVDLVSRLREVGVRLPKPKTEQAALDCFQYVWATTTSSQPAPQDEEDGEQQVIAGGISCLDKPKSCEQLTSRLAWKLVKVYRRYKGFVMALRLELFNNPWQWISAVATAAEAEVLLELVSNNRKPDAAVPLSTVELRQKLIAYWESDFHRGIANGNDGSRTFHNMFQYSILVPGQAAAASTEAAEISVEPSFERSRVRDLCWSNAWELKVRLKILCELETASSVNEFQDVFAVAMVFLQNKLLELTAQYEKKWTSKEVLTMFVNYVNDRHD